MTNYGADSSYDAQEFDVVFLETHLTIRNKKEDLALENVSSSDGNMTVTPVNEPGAAAILASQNAFASEMRVQLIQVRLASDYRLLELIVSYSLLMGNKTQLTLRLTSVLE